ncbi:MAG: carbon-nitrogen hydrolase family protein [Pirellulales bacterium]|nr:carbon-nitrogen hydrolase family protein [Pirellulales bacterium]
MHSKAHTCHHPGTLRDVAILLAACCLVSNESSVVAQAARPTPAPAAPTTKVAGIVLKWIRQDKEANWQRVEPLIRRATADGAQLICTTECFLDGYAIADKTIPLEEYQRLGEPIPAGKYFRKLAALADELEIYLVAGMLEADGPLRYNTAVLLGPDGALVGKYRKQKLQHELVRNTPGVDSPVFDTALGKIGIMICADRTEPEIVRKISDSGADFLVCPSGGMFGTIKNDPIVQARSRENHKFILFVHPAEFLVTRPDGTNAVQQIVGDRLLIDAAERNGPSDEPAIYYFDLPRFDADR